MNPYRMLAAPTLAALILCVGEAEAAERTVLLEHFTNYR
jgi:hypothetical protein